MSADRVWQHLVGVQHFAGERIVPQGAGGAGAAVVQHLAAVLRLLLVLSLQIGRSLRGTPGSGFQMNGTREKKLNSGQPGRRLPRARDRGCRGCSSARSPAPPSLGSWRSSATFPRRRRPASAGPDEPRPSLSPSKGHVMFTVRTEVGAQ